MNKITRREFLEGASAAALVPVSARADDSKPTFHLDGDDVAVQIDGGTIWTIRPKRIAPTAHAQVQVDPGKVRIVGGKFPNELGFELDFDFTRLLGKWCVVAHWRFSSIGVSAASDPVVLAGRMRFRAAIHGRKLAMLSENLAGEMLLAPNKALLDFDTDFEISMDATPNYFSALKRKFASHQLSVLPASGRVEFKFGDDTPATKIELGSYEVTAASLRAAANTAVSFSGGKLTLHGALDLVVHNDKTHTATIPCETAVIAPGRSHRAWTLAPRADFWRLNLPNASFEVTADEAGANSRRPIELAENRNGVLTGLTADVRVYSSTIALADVDRTRFDINGQSIRLALANQPATAPAPGAPNPPPLTTFVLGIPDAAFKLNLDKATLRLWRGNDLFCLSFQFSQINLVVAKRAQLVPMTGEEIRKRIERYPTLMDEINSGKSTIEPVLAADFPPQHIMERTFLRQNRPLPDAGDEVTPAELRELQRLGIGAGEDLRRKLRTAKIDAEDKLIPPGDPHPFKDFAEVWAKDTVLSGKFGSWIGPAGLFTLEARREARRFAEKRRLERLTKLRAKASSNTLANGDFGQTVDVLGMPVFPLSYAESRTLLAKSPAVTDTNEKLKLLLAEADQRDPDFEYFQKKSRDKFSEPLMLPGWPFSDADWQAVFAPPPPTPPPAPIAGPPISVNLQAILKILLDEQFNAQSDTVAAGGNPEDFPEGFRRPVEAWLAEPSRLAFAVKSGPIELTVEALTGWEKFELRVIQRAKRLYGRCTVNDPQGQNPESDPATVLESQGIPKNDESAVNRMAAIGKTMQPPTRFETALEVPTGLILSPAQDTLWITPKTLPADMMKFWRDDAAPTAVWQARMVEKTKVPSLRAVWARDFDKIAPFGRQPDKWTPPGSERQVRTAMSPQDRAELVALTSMYGLPVIASGDKNQSSQIETPKEYKITADGETAIYMPVPLQTRRLALGATGAMLDLDTMFPAVTSVRVDGKPLYDSFSLQRWRSLVSDGSDVVTTVVRRGYLFPLCHKASLIKVTEPRLRPIDPARPSLGYSVEQATRIFIEVTRATHHYPAVGQANGGRSLQPHDVTLLTLRTPDLIDASDDRPLKDFDKGVKPETIADAIAPKTPLIAGQHGAIRGWIDQGDKRRGPVPGRMVGKVFWPRTEVGTKGTVRFRMRIDRGSAPVSMPLIFVDHTAASDRATMEALCTRYYNGGLGPDGDKPKDWNKVQHNGALRTYADEQRQGQCTFATDWQLIQVEGGATSFNQDASLLAAEQPPFYPRMALAQIRPQQIQGLTGSGAPALQVAYACDYERFGFNPPANLNIADPDTYLVVTNNPRPMLDMGDHGDQGGTVARKAMEICGLNRRFGLAGPPLRGCTAAPLPTTSTSPPLPPPPPAVAPATLPLFVPQKAKCDPSEKPDERSYDKLLALGHFGDEAKLFGLIKLSDFIQLIAGEIGSNIIPKLEEITNFTSDALTRVVNALLTPVNLLQDQLVKVAGDVVFPDFAAALRDLQCELTKVGSGPAQSELQQIESSTRIWAAGQQVARELDAIARTPVGDIAERLRAHLIRSQAKIVEELGKFTPWIPLQEKLAELVADGAKLLPDSMITVALPDPLGSQLAAKVARAVAQPSVWRDPDPLQRIIEAVRNDPAPPTIPNLNQILVKGVLFDLAKDLLSILQDNIKDKFDPASVSAAVDWAEGAIKKAQELRDRITKLADVTLALCNKAVEALNEIFVAVVPDIYSRPVPLVSSSEGEKAVAAIRKSVDDIRKIKADIESSAAAFGPAVQPMLRFLDAWATNLESSADKLTAALAATATARKDVAEALGASASCTTFDIKVARVMAALIAARRNLVTVWLDAAGSLPASPPLPAPTGAPAALLQLWQDVLNKIANVLTTNVTAAMNVTLLNAASAGKTQWEKAKTDLSGLAGPLPDLADVLLQADKAISDATTRLAGALQLPAPLPADPATLRSVVRDKIAAVRGIEEALHEPETKLFNSVLRVAISRLLKAIEPNLDKYSKSILEGIGLVYDQMLTVRDGAYLTVQRQLGPEGFGLIEKLFGKPPSDSQPPGCTDDWGRFVFYIPLAAGGACEVDANGHATNEGLVNERNEILAGTAAMLTTILGRWKSGNAAPQKIAKHVEYFAKFGVRAAILKVLDVEQLRQQITDALSLALPTTRTLKSNMALPLHTTSVGLGTFRPLGDGSLKLNTTATINLLKPQVPQAKFEGIVSPFELDILSIMTFSFKKGVTYTKAPGDNRGRIEAPLGAEDIKFGDKLSFLADLSRSLSFGGGDGTDGPYTILHIDNPSIEAGYRIAIPVITLGVTFTNIHFACAVILPFNSGNARLRAALGSLDAPFMISVGIYGGSGFMGIEASAQGIEAFEASFEFGGIASIGYGPLQGTAYVTTGAYVRKDGLGCTFAALFSAGFTAHIACFGISAAFTLRLYKRDGDSSVQGEAQLTFTFSVGVLKVHYTIRVARTMQAGFGGGGQQAADNSLPGRRVQLAALGGFTPDCYPFEQAATLNVESLSPAETWSAFEAQFDPQFFPGPSA
jgi:hypothetical protein